MRVAVGDRRVQADLGEAPDHLGPDGGPAGPSAARGGEAGAQAVGDLPSAGQLRVEHGEGVLQEQGHPVAAQGGALARGQGAQVGAVEADGAAGDLDAVREQPHGGAHREGLAAAGLAHDRDGLPASDGEGDAVEEGTGVPEAVAASRSPSTARSGGTGAGADTAIRTSHGR